MAPCSLGDVWPSARYYSVTHADKFTIDWPAFYQRANRLTLQTRLRLRCHLNMAYGSAPKQRLDIYCPLKSADLCSVFIFMHGGGFREGDRVDYGYVAAQLADHEIITVVPSYRLTPSARYPEQNLDTRAIIEWVYRQISWYGGDPARICIGGHSAGGILSASVGVATTWLPSVGLPLDLIKGIVPISAEYDLRDRTRFAAFDEYLPDVKSREDASPALNIDHPVRRAVVAVGSVEPHVKSSEELVAKLRDENVDAELLILPGLAHDQTALALAERGALVDSIVRICGP